MLACGGWAGVIALLAKVLWFGLFRPFNHEL